MIFTTYLDDSGTHDESPNTILAGYVGSAGQWRKFEKKWGQLLDDEDLPYFHAKEIKSWNDDEKAIRFTTQAQLISRKQVLFGFAINLNNADYSAHYIGTSRPQGMAVDSKYGLCVRMATTFVPQLLLQMFGDECSKIYFILESGHKNSGDAERIFHQFKQSAPFKKVLGTLTFAEKKECYGCQLADALAWSAYGWERDGEAKISTIKGEKPSDLLAEAARGINGEKKLFRVLPNERILTELRNGLYLDLQARKQYGAKKAKPSSSSAS